MTAFIPSETVRLTEATRHAVAHRIKVRDGKIVTTRCGWTPPTVGAIMRLGDAVAEYGAYCCVRCFATQS